VAVAFVRVALVARRFWKIPEAAYKEAPVAFVKLRVEIVDDPATKSPVRFSVVPEALANWRYVA
jgi:hypothetical protein